MRVLKDEWETIPMESGIIHTNHTTGETWGLSVIRHEEAWQRIGEPIHGFKVWFFGSD